MCTFLKKKVRTSFFALNQYQQLLCQNLFSIFLNTCKERGERKFSILLQPQDGQICYILTSPSSIFQESHGQEFHLPKEKLSNWIKIEAKIRKHVQYSNTIDMSFPDSFTFTSLEPLFAFIANNISLANIENCTAKSLSMLPRYKEMKRPNNASGKHGGIGSIQRGSY